MTAYELIGTTDENTECDVCGRIELRSTVVFDILDADGNRTGNLLYAGSSCATTLPGFTRRSASTILSRARALQTAADREAVAGRVSARRVLAKYQAVSSAKGGELARVFFGFNPGVRGKVNARDEVTKLVADAHAKLAGFEWEPVGEAESLVLLDLADMASEMRQAATLLEAAEIGRR